MKTLVILVLSLVLISCSKDAEETIKTSNKEINVELLFEVDGCRVYRFFDSSYRYFSNCARNSMTQWDESCGKNCTRHINLPTAYRD